MKKVAAILILAALTTGVAEARDRGGYNQNYNRGYNQNYNQNYGNYVAPLVAGAVIGAVVGAVASNYYQPVYNVVQPVCYSEPIIIYVYDPVQQMMMPAQQMKTICR